MWDIEYPKAPIVVLNAHAQAHCLEYNPKDPPCLVSGMVTGQTCEMGLCFAISLTYFVTFKFFPSYRAAYDVRVNNSFPVMMSRRENSHQDRVNAVTFYCSKTNMEFFSGSAAGEIFWWDLRNLETPIDTLLVDGTPMLDGIKNTDRAFGVN